MNYEDWVFWRWNIKIGFYYRFHHQQEILDRQLLHEAKEGRGDQVRCLLGDGANPNAPFGFTILGEAARSHLRNPECVRLLLEHNAQVNPTNNFTLAPLIRASHLSDEECIRLLVEAGANLNVFDSHFTGAHTPLQQLITWASLPFLQWFVAQGADIGMRGGHGQTALDMAMACERVEVIEWLVGPMKTPKTTKG